MVFVVVEAEEAHQVVLDFVEFVPAMIIQIVLTPREEHDWLLVTNLRIGDP